MAAKAWSATASNVFTVLTMISLGWVWAAGGETSRKSWADKVAALMHKASAGNDRSFAREGVLRIMVLLSWQGWNQKSSRRAAPSVAKPGCLQQPNLFSSA
jgi:hypothetical protein